MRSDVQDVYFKKEPHAARRLYIEAPRGRVTWATMRGQRGQTVGKGCGHCFCAIEEAS